MRGKVKGLKIIKERGNNNNKQKKKKRKIGIMDIKLGRYLEQIYIS